MNILKKNFIKKFNLRGLKIVIDCANGAGYKSGPNLLKSLGAKVISLGIRPDGLNINKECGSTFPKKIQSSVKKHKANIGISLDGDADRIIMCDEKGKIIDGDQIIAALARRWKSKKMLKGGVVGTLMSNYGLEKFFKKSRTEATQIMLHVHQKGMGVCGLYPYEVAETKVVQVMDYARKNEHPLQCAMEKE